eukprot:TRINITY_DN24892_c0_g1_i1.p1 TRINITY_DN24892_c0_g1~~TRINITY_DN24892_c0_g1_i1.p1  ORF type:complete len:275 (+),score=31.74 TRINITY_DN24892_c0_g1_i1:179-1003(+)
MNPKLESRRADTAPGILRLHLETPGHKVSSLRPSPTTKSLIYEQKKHVAHILGPPEVSHPVPLLLVLHQHKNSFPPCVHTELLEYNATARQGDKLWRKSAKLLQEIEFQVLSWAQMAQTHNIVIVYPFARDDTWDYITAGTREDISFIEAAINAARRTFPVDDRRIATIGISDGGSLALSLAVHNQDIFQAAISASAGFCASIPPVPHPGRTPKMFLKHGSEDETYPLRAVGLRVRDLLLRGGLEVEFRVGQGEGHSLKDFHSEFIPMWLAMGS